MGTCLSTGKSPSKPEEKGINKLNIHPATGLQPGDLPYPTKSNTTSRQGTPSRRPSTTDSSGKKSPVPSAFNPGGLLLALSSITSPEAVTQDSGSAIQLELYDNCPTPYPGMSKIDVGISEEASALMRIDFTAASVNERNVKQQMDELITGPEALHVRGGLRTVLGVCPDSDEEVFNASYLFRSEHQQHISCDKNKHFCLRAPKGLQLRIVCVSYHGHDYVAAANALLQNSNTLLEVAAGKLEEKLKCPPPKSSLSLEAPFLFTYVLESEIFHKTCGIFKDFLIDKYEPVKEDEPVKPESTE